VAQSASGVAILANNASSSTGSSLLTGDLAAIRLEMDTHFFGTLAATRAVTMSQSPESSRPGYAPTYRPALGHQFDDIRPDDVQVVGDQAVEERARRPGPDEHSGAGHIDPGRRQPLGVAVAGERCGVRFLVVRAGPALAEDAAAAG
jgi:hypothetical protein